MTKSNFWPISPFKQFKTSKWWQDLIYGSVMLKFCVSFFNMLHNLGSWKGRGGGIKSFLGPTFCLHLKKMQKVLKTVNQAANAKLGFLKNYKRNSFTNMKQILFWTRAVSVLPYRNPYQMEIFQSVGLKVISVATSNINEFKEGRTW